MENKWKRFGTIVIVIYMILITTAAGIFATLFFVNRNENSPSATNLTLAEAQELIERACRDRGIITGTSANSLAPVRYDGNDLFAPDGDGKYGIKYQAQYHDLFLMQAKACVDSSLDQNVWYIDSIMGGDGNPYKFYIKGQSFYYENRSNNDFKNEDFYPHANKIIITKTGVDTYKTVSYIQALTTLADPSTHEPIQSALTTYTMSFEADANGMYMMQLEGYSYSIPKTIPTNKLTSLENVGLAQFYNCNLKAHTMVDGISDGALTDAEKLQIVNNTISKMNAELGGAKTSAYFGEIKTNTDLTMWDEYNEYLNNMNK